MFAWLVAYNIIQPLADWISYSVLGLTHESHFGESLAFLMSVIGLGLPEAVILKRVLKIPLFITFFFMIAAAIMLTGFMFNLI